MIERRYELGGGLEAILTLSPNGQQPVHEGDGVQVRAEVSLPASEDGWSIHPNLWFQFRSEYCDMTLMGASLSQTWGEKFARASTTVRRKAKNFHAATWGEAYKVAEEAVVAEIAQLMAAVFKRRTFLLAAGPEDGGNPVTVPVPGEAIRRLIEAVAEVVGSK